MLTEEITKGSHQRKYIIGTHYQDRGGPIAFASVTYLFIFSSLRKICQFPERLMNEKASMKKDRKNVRLHNKRADNDLLGIVKENLFPFA